MDPSTQLDTEFKDIDLLHNLVKKNKSYNWLYKLSRYGKELEGECNYFLENLVRKRMNEEEDFRLSIYRYEHSLSFRKCLQVIDLYSLVKREAIDWVINNQKTRDSPYTYMYPLLTDKFCHDVASFPMWKLCSNMNEFCSIINPLYNTLIHMDDHIRYKSNYHQKELYKMMGVFVSRNYKHIHEDIRDEIRNKYIEFIFNEYLWMP
jgi:hypothetical protein